ncbi:intradiol ring-cleavage dioxygenase [Aquisphaera insulae]|uniref:intradiol ring-cleavage dioxygenase n=1 Tax=Aquisphaera insulae TaxID=2712864 RepID=UPI0013EB6001|nr:intradiol ring-cleavage dioxygenase [Aquisphaera insulae]
MTDESNMPASRTSRRELMRKGAAAGAAITVLTRGTVRASNMVADESPGLTEGPYWVDEMLNRSNIRIDPSTGIVQPGLPLTLAINVSQVNADGSVSPLPGAYVDIWHCSASGVYSDVAAQNTVGEKFLRGYQVTNAHGNVRFLSIYPGWYSGRTVHIHVRVRVYDATTDTVTYNFTTQLFFDDAITDDVFANVAPYNARGMRDTTNANDDIFLGSSANGIPAANAGAEMLLTLFENRVRATGTINIVLDLSDAANEDPTNGAEAGSDGAGGGPGGGGGGGAPPDGGGTPPPGGGTPPGGGGTPPPGGGGPPGSSR